jgi:drug/metabolite transporter (DMT)-like permease
VHDVCVRLAADRAGVNLSLLVVLVTGLAVILPLSFVAGDWSGMTTRNAIFAGLSGFIYAGASYSLYRAFAIGPVRLVAPIVATYPILSVIWAVWQGAEPSPGQAVAVLAIVVGVGLMAALANDPQDAANDGHRRRAAPLWAAMASCGFALTFAVGQVASSGGAELPVVALSRAAAVLALAGGLAALRVWPEASGAPWRLLIMMGLCDIAAITLVLGSGSLPHPEFASIMSSIFGMVTILLACVFLKERVTLAQWGAAVLVFAGIGYLAA